MSIHHLLAVLLLAALCCGTVSAAATTLTVSVYDAGSGNDPLYDAKVSLTDNGMNQTRYTDTDGVALFGTVEYQHSYVLEVAKDGYDTYSMVLPVNEQDKSYSVYMQKANLVQIRVRDASTQSAVPGAAVVIDGYQAGTTNAAGVIHVSLSKDAYHDITVTAPTYETYTSSQYLDPGQTSLVLSLTRSYFTPLVLVYNQNHAAVAGASVSLNGSFAGYTDTYGRATLTRQTPGTYLLAVTKDGFVPYEQPATFSADSPDIVVDLAYATVPVIILAMDGDTPVAAAYVSLDGVVTGFTNATGAYETKAAPGTSLTIAVSKDGYTGSGMSYQVAETGSNAVVMPLSPVLRPEYVLAAGLAVIAVLLVLILLRTGGKKKRGKRGKSGKRDSL
jgi:hypothetical protein